MTRKAITYMLLTFSIIFSSCSKYIETVSVSEPKKVKGSEKVIEEKYYVEKEENPTIETPNMKVKCSVEQKIQYNTYIYQKNKYEDLTQGWLLYGLAMSTLTGGIALSLTAKKNNDLLFILALASPFVIGYSTNDLPAKHFKKSIRKKGPTRKDTFLLPLIDEVEVYSNYHENKYLSGKNGVIKINMLDFQFPQSEYNDYEFKFKTNNKNFENSIKLNSKMWIQKSPPYLVVKKPLFIDSDGNNRIDSNETSYINFSIENQGKGFAYNLKAEVNELNHINGLMVKNVDIGTLSLNEAKDVSIPIYSDMNLETGITKFKVSVREDNGFDTDPFYLTVNTLEFQKPNVVVSDYKFTSEFDKMKLGIPITLKIFVQNIGQGKAEDVTISFNLKQDNVFVSGERTFLVKEINPGETREINFEFFANKRFEGKKIGIVVQTNEKYRKYGERKSVFVEIDQPIEKQITVYGEEFTEKQIELSKMTSDVDRNIPVNPTTNENCYALIIGNEDYSSKQLGLSKESDVEYAKNDAKIFKKYVNKTFGVPEKNITLLTDATTGEINQAIAKLNTISSIIGDNIEIIFYYAGHGLPDEITKEPYIIPVDVSSSNLQYAISLKEIYEKLTEYPVKKVSVFLDACFSGGARNQGLLATRGVRIKPKANYLSGNIVVFSSSTSEESSNSLDNKNHGIFTYYLLKKIQETNGNITYKDLSDYVIDKVKLESVILNNKLQTPQVNTSIAVQDKCGKWRFK